MEPPFQERRKHVVSHEHIQAYQASIRQHFDERFDEQRKHIDSRFDEQDKKLASAFPDGDLEGHRRAHEEVIATIKDRADLWKAVREKTVSGGVYAALGLLMLALWEYAKAHLASPK